MSSKTSLLLNRRAPWPLVLIACIALIGVTLIARVIAEGISDEADRAIDRLMCPVPLVASYNHQSVAHHQGPSAGVLRSSPESPSVAEPEELN